MYFEIWILCRKMGHILFVIKAFKQFLKINSGLYLIIPRINLLILKKVAQ